MKAVGFGWASERYLIHIERIRYVAYIVINTVLFNSQQFSTQLYSSTFQGDEYTIYALTSTIIQMLKWHAARREKTLCENTASPNNKN